MSEFGFSTHKSAPSGNVPLGRFRRLVDLPRPHPARRTSSVLEVPEDYFTATRTYKIKDLQPRTKNGLPVVRCRRRGLDYQPPGVLLTVRWPDGVRNHCLHITSLRYKYFSSKCLCWRRIAWQRRHKSTPPRRLISDSSTERIHPQQ